MCEYEVGVSGHEVEFVVIGGGDEDERDEVGFGVIHFAFRELFIPGDFVGLFKGCKEIDKHEVSVITCFEGVLPSIENEEFVVGLECAFGCFDQVGVFCDEDELHVMTIEDG